MQTIITILHILICILLIVVILLQSGSAGDLASAFGGMGSQTAFGPRGGQTALGKSTVVLAILFAATTVSLAIISNRQHNNVSSILGSHAAKTHQTAPVKTPPPPKP
ncbi:MAG: preprotein translocase subunit SecG [Terriglobales bacterium]